MRGEIKDVDLDSGDYNERIKGLTEELYLGYNM
jgi:hypothetical protein